MVYLGVYTDDYGKKTYYRLEVFLVANGTRQETDRSLDNDYLPDVYKASVLLSDGTVPSCPKNTTPRYAKLYINSTDYLHVDLPFPPSSSEYNQFFISASFNPLIISVGLQGERITNHFLKYAVS